MQMHTFSAQWRGRIAAPNVAFHFWRINAIANPPLYESDLRSLIDVHPRHAHVIGVAVTEVQLGRRAATARIHVE